jgi:Beta-lactamase superfamily domain
VAAAHRPDLRRPRPEVHLRLGVGVPQDHRPGGRRLGGNAVGLIPWQASTIGNGARGSITVTATPARHGPPLSRPVAGEVIGFALGWERQEHGVLWISGDTVLSDGVRRVAERLTVDIAVLHLGAVRFGVTGPVRYTMTAREAVDLCRLLRPRTVLPVHYEGWGHFREGRQAIEARSRPHPTRSARPCAGFPLAVPSLSDSSVGRCRFGGHRRLVEGVERAVSPCQQRPHDRRCAPALVTPGSGLSTVTACRTRRGQGHHGGTGWPSSPPTPAGRSTARSWPPR